MENKKEIGVAVITPSQSEIIKSLVLEGDIAKMTGEQQVEYYNQFCKSLGLNPLTQPFQIITFKGKKKLYATKDCTEQLRKLYKVSITEVNGVPIQDCYMVTAKAVDGNGKVDVATGVVSIAGLKGEDLANAIMKSETKAKRRVTLSICGLGILDESELDTMPEDLDSKINVQDTILLVPDDLKDTIQQATLEQLSTIYGDNSHLHSNPDFMGMLKKRKAELKAEKKQIEETTKTK